MRVLFLGYGNPGRQDDGLGPAFIEELEKEGLPGVAAGSDYQLTVEDAAAVAQSEVVVFVDASFEGERAFDFRPLEAGSSISFTSHRMAPEELLALAKNLFAARPKAYLLTIRGYEFSGFGEGLSSQAQMNLNAALNFVKDWLLSQGVQVAEAEDKGALQSKKAANL